MKRVVVDTNVWVSAAIEPLGPPAKVTGAVTQGPFVLVLSAPLLEELSRVLRRPRLVRLHRRTPAEIDQLVADLRESCEWVEVTSGRPRYLHGEG